jgi:O-antigen/teichoic acid export membrane protein
MFGVVARVTQVATRLVTVPIVIAHLGLGGYGIWSIVMTIAAYMRFGSIGIKCAFQKYVAESMGGGDFETTNQLLSTGCAAMAVVSVVGVIPAAFYSTTLAKLSGVPPAFLHSAAWSITILGVILVFSNVGAVFEAIVMGGQRIDLARNFTTLFTVGEASAIVVLLHMGYGLIAMASVMAASETGFVICCYISSRKLLPQVRVSPSFITRTVCRELFRFAGSYQLVSVLEMLYLAILPVTILRSFGAESSGIYALTQRLVISVLLLPDALLLPVLSGGAMIYSSGSAEQMHRLVAKAFKATLALSLFPLGFLSAFGTVLVYAWTGQDNYSFQTALWIVCAAGLFQSYSGLCLVLYRASGKALADNLKQLLRIAVLLTIAWFARELGFYGVLGGLAVAEFAGMLFMFYVINQTFHFINVKAIVHDGIRIGATTVLVLALALLLDRLISAPPQVVGRWLALFRLAKVSLVCLFAIWPISVLTGSVTKTESKALMGAVLLRGIRSPQANPERV